MGARDGYNRIFSPHVRLFPHNNSENPSYSLPSTIRCSFALSTIKEDEEESEAELDDIMN